MSFASLGLSAPIVSAVADAGYNQPSPIQLKAIPAILSGKDVMGAAQTGTGKTAGFTLPILEKLLTGERAKSNRCRALILTPTRELAAQIADNVEIYGKNLPLRSTVVFGGVKINPQMMKLRKGADVLVATPGRLMDLYSQNALKLDSVEMVVLDEADRMLDMGFIHEIRKIIRLLPKNRQNLMFSATFSDAIRKLAKTIVNNPVEISVTPKNSTVNSVAHWIIPADKSKKSALLVHLIKNNQWPQVLVFSRTKHGANRLVSFLDKAGLAAGAIHGNKSQGARTRVLSEFKNFKLQVLVATDIAARGIDIDQLPYVVNFDLPNVPEDYVHRIGRTGRAGATGQAVSLVSADEYKQLFDIEKLIGRILKREFEDGFIPTHDLPESKSPRQAGNNAVKQRSSSNKRKKIPSSSASKPASSDLTRRREAKFTKKKKTTHHKAQKQRKPATSKLSAVHNRNNQK